MKLEIELTDDEAKLIHTLIRRMIFEDYIRPMAEAGDTKEETEARVYDTIYAVNKVKKAIAKEWNK